MTAICDCLPSIALAHAKSRTPILALLPRLIARRNSPKERPRRRNWIQQSQQHGQQHGQQSQQHGQHKPNGCETTPFQTSTHNKQGRLLSFKQANFPAVNAGLDRKQNEKRYETADSETTRKASKRLEQQASNRNAGNEIQTHRTTARRQRN